jgi:hypothetical protein
MALAESWHPSLNLFNTPVCLRLWGLLHLEPQFVTFTFETSSSASILSSPTPFTLLFTVGHGGLHIRQAIAPSVSSHIKGLPNFGCGLEDEVENIRWLKHPNSTAAQRATLEQLALKGSCTTHTGSTIAMEL